MSQKSTENPVAKAKKIIADILYITIATVTPDGLPWNSPVYSAFDEKYNFYWLSWQENQHSKNIRNNSHVYIVIYDSQAHEGKGVGVYIQAKASELSDEKEMAHALKLLYGRKSKKPREVHEFQDDFPRRIYKAIPQKVWMNIDSKIKGNFIDSKVEVKLT